jgi:pimeloyl-ACP methyl ester carboxylesterase
MKSIWGRYLMYLATSVRVAFLLASVWLNGCSTVPAPAERKIRADETAAAAGWTSQRIVAGDFVLAGYLSPVLQSGAALTIYIEGDGAAWLNRSTPSKDPTPVNPTGLNLALRHQRGPAAYLARPCQFVAGTDRHGCSVEYWTSARFAATIIDAEDIAIDILKVQTGAQRVVLVGYSGGGAVAALLASRRKDVDRLVTVAGNLDHATWTRLHGVEPLVGSLNPADEWRALVAIPQVHFVGSKDTVVDGRIASAYARRFPEPRPRIVTVDGFDHACCWTEAWPRLQGDAFGGLR